ncbi:MAG: DUF1800 domain-containing protein [Hellea sp.]|nr:DUF1800 domain-containing protein [Hellea sp.]
MLIITLSLSLAACGGSGGSGSAPPPGGGGGPNPPPPPPPPPSGAFKDEQGTARFLSQATFGTNMEQIDNLTETLASQWFVDQLSIPPSYNLAIVNNAASQPGAFIPGEGFTVAVRQLPTDLFWKNAIEGDDQLRQRMSFALSQIIVASHREGNLLFELPFTFAHYQDILTENALGNYRDLLEDITYSPAMGYYLTYFQNTKGDPVTGRMPDENYAREVMQLFSIGLVELNMDGTVKTDGQGNPLETYDNVDVSGMAKVFTGFSLDHPDFYPQRDALELSDYSSPMKIFDEYHSDLEKSFLGTTIPAGTNGTQSVDQALDALVDHPNTPPFVARQIIQRFVTSHPEPAYVERVATAFANGSYTLPDGTAVGDGRRGDLAATLAAVLFDDEAREAGGFDGDDFGKVREPVLRFTQWARAFDANTVTPEYTLILFNTSSNDALAQAPFKSPSVFNFYRPGYIAPGTETGDAGLTMPEMQLVNAASISGYANFMTYFSLELLADGAQGPGMNSFRPDYSDEIALADDPAALVERLDLLLVNGSMSQESKDTIIAILEDLPLENANDPNYDGPRFRTQLAVVLVMTAPDYIVQR